MANERLTEVTNRYSNSRGNDTFTTDIFRGNEHKSYTEFDILTFILVFTSITNRI